MRGAINSHWQDVESLLLQWLPNALSRATILLSARPPGSLNKGRCKLELLPDLPVNTQPRFADDADARMTQKDMIYGRTAWDCWKASFMCGKLTPLPDHLLSAGWAKGESLCRSSSFMHEYCHVCPSLWTYGMSDRVLLIIELQCLMCKCLLNYLYL